RVDGGVPGKKAKAKITTVYDNSAKADLIEFTGDADLDDEDEDDGDERTTSGSREDWFGG
ncbi:MAG: deoxyribonuclease, partial [Halobacteria archaeon]|nr:deoxyribonuclease [Halobacteria archaeon]